MTGLAAACDALLPRRARAFLLRSTRARVSVAVLGLWLVAALAGAALDHAPPPGTLGAVVGGARSTGTVVLGVLLIALPCGWVLGLLAGAGPRVVDGLLTRLLELGSPWPTVVLLAVARAAEPVPTLGTFVVIVGLTRALHIARLVRGEALILDGAPHVLAARALGASALRRLVVHIAPLTVAPVLVAAASTAAVTIGLDAGLSWIGLGAPAGHPSWGTQIGATSRAAVLAPASAALLTSIACMLLADALEDAVHPLRSLRLPPPAAQPTPIPKKTR